MDGPLQLPASLPKLDSLKASEGGQSSAGRDSPFGSRKLAGLVAVLHFKTTISMNSLKNDTGEQAEGQCVS